MIRIGYSHVLMRLEKNEVMHLLFQKTINPDFDEYHATMMILSKELKFKCERKAKHK